MAVASVSHDGEAVYGAQVIAAMEAQAFVENDLNRLIDTTWLKKRSCSKNDAYISFFYWQLEEKITRSLWRVYEFSKRSHV